MADEKLPSKDHVWALLTLSTKVEIMLKKLRSGTDEEFKEVIAIAKSAMEMSKRIYGEHTFCTNATVLTYAMTLTKVKSMEAESVQWFEQAESVFEVINGNIANKFKD